MNSFILLFTVSLPFLACIITTTAAIILPENATIQAIIVFGDSIVDTGNNNYIPTISKCNFSPYGKDFEGGKPTGRFSDGKVPSDLLAEELGIKSLVPPYLDPSLQPHDLLTGVNFASGASGWDPLTSYVYPKVLSLSDQLELFKDYVTKLKKIAGEERSSIILRESLFAVFTGSNDITNTYFTTPLRRNFDVPSYIDVLLGFASTFVQDLYRLGARRIVVSGLPPIGCLPSQRTLKGGIERKCVDKYNEIAQLFNKKLSDQLASTNTQWTDARISYVDIYNLLYDIIKSPEKYGFKIANRGCCGTGTYEASILCRYACPNVADHVFWDAFHPTEKTYKFLVRQFFEQYLRNNTCGNSLC